MFHSWKKLSDNVHYCAKCNVIRTGIQLHSNTSLRRYEYTNQKGVVIGKNWPPDCQDPPAETETPSNIRRIY